MFCLVCGHFHLSPVRRKNHEENGSSSCPRPVLPIHVRAFRLLSLLPLEYACELQVHCLQEPFLYEHEAEHFKNIEAEERRRIFSLDHSTRSWKFLFSAIINVHI